MYMHEIVANFLYASNFALGQNLCNFDDPPTVNVFQFNTISDIQMTATMLIATTRQNMLHLLNLSFNLAIFTFTTSLQSYFAQVL